MLLKLLIYFADERASRIFARLNMSTGKRPELATCQAMKQDKTIMSNNCRCAQLKAMASNVYGDHLYALRWG